LKKIPFGQFSLQKTMGYKKNTYFCMQSILVAKQEVDKNDSQ